MSATPNPRSSLNPLAADAKPRGLKPVLSPNPRPVRENAIAQKAQKDRLKASLATMDWESNANGQANVQSTGPEITIRGLAGPYTVVGSNFAPGTTAADIEAAMLPIGGQMQNCQVGSFPRHYTTIPLDFGALPGKLDIQDLKPSLDATTSPVMSLIAKSDRFVSLRDSISRISSMLTPNAIADRNQSA